MSQRAWKKAISVLFFLFSLIGNKAFAGDKVDPMVVAFCREWSAPIERTEDERWESALGALKAAAVEPPRRVAAPLELSGCVERFGAELTRARFIVAGSEQVRKSLEQAQGNRVDRDDSDVFQFSGVEALKDRDRRYRELWRDLVARLRSSSVARR